MVLRPVGKPLEILCWKSPHFFNTGCINEQMNASANRLPQNYTHQCIQLLINQICNFMFSSMFSVYTLLTPQLIWSLHYWMNVSVHWLKVCEYNKQLHNEAAYSSGISRICVKNHQNLAISLLFDRETAVAFFARIGTRMGWKVHRMTSYLLLMTFFTNVIQALQLRWRKCLQRKNKP